jgi:hypothetical protein
VGDYILNVDVCHDAAGDKEHMLMADVNDLAAGCFQLSYFPL